MNRSIMHIDRDSFFVSVERLVNLHSYYPIYQIGLVLVFLVATDFNANNQVDKTRTIA